MHAVSTNQIPDIWHFNSKSFYDIAEAYLGSWTLSDIYVDDLS